jgi:hypothetical protein
MENLLDVSKVVFTPTLEKVFCEWFEDKFGRQPLGHNQKDIDLREAFLRGFESYLEIYVYSQS